MLSLLFLVLLFVGVAVVNVIVIVIVEGWQTEGHTLILRFSSQLKSLNDTKHLGQDYILFFFRSR